MVQKNGYKDRRLSGRCRRVRNYGQVNEKVFRKTYVIRQVGFTKAGNGLLVAWSHNGLDNKRHSRQDNGDVKDFHDYRI